MKGQVLSYLDFELAYLALLTKHQVKRLSRWEGRLLRDQKAVLKDLGLHIAGVKRRILLDRKIDEVVFSARKEYTDFYRSRFHLTPTKETPAEVRLKGFLFGYPSCCVEAYIRRPYSKNDLSPRDQGILFHWACRGCKITPMLLRDYREIYSECVKVFGGVVPVKRKAQAGEQESSLSTFALKIQRKALPVAACLSALLLFPQIGRGDDPHQLQVQDDQDQDFLSYGEEIVGGFNWSRADTDSDSIPDGTFEAALLDSLIANLPDSIQTDRPYKVDCLQFGIEYCQTCSAEVNMGYVHIVHPLRGLEVDVPYICLHYLEHGSLGYAGTIHSGRLDLRLLERILLPYDGDHLLPIGDIDDDGLFAEEETFLGTDPMDSDTDDDSVNDGPQFAEDLVAALSGLPREVRDNEPYLIEHRVKGYEYCDICGARYNMGWVDIINPVEGVSLETPFMSLHSLGHGSAAFDATYNEGRVPPILLQTVLTGTGSSHWIAIEGDTDLDGLKDEEETHFSLNASVHDTDGNGIPDGPQVASCMCTAIDSLPEGPLPDTTYVVHHQARGVYGCLICGEGVNMGYLEIVNPQSGLTVDLPYYNLHFMRRGSFSTDRPDTCPRIDPRDIDNVLELSSYVPPGMEQSTHPVLIYPNPSRGSTRIVCNLPGISSLRIRIYDASGRLISDLSHDAYRYREVLWKAADAEGNRLPSGIYFCKIDVGDFSFTTKIVLVE